MANEHDKKEMTKDDFYNAFNYLLNNYMHRLTQYEMGQLVMLCASEELMIEAYEDFQRGLKNADSA